MIRKFNKVLCRDCVYCEFRSSMTSLCCRNPPGFSDSGWAAWPEVCVDRDWCGEGVSAKTKYDHSYFNQTKED